MRKYKHPSVQNGSINHEAASFPVVDGVVELPDHVAEAAGLTAEHAVPDPKPAKGDKGQEQKSDPKPAKGDKKGKDDASE